RSKHQDGKAIDVYYVGWESGDSLTDDRWYILIESFKKAGKMLGLRLAFGYDWGWDNPHIELR
ncbi:MAG: M15 family peptidase, partial [Fusobacterium mortiferum]|nr:M15 family peptidase [Fusobacterium mortiferum]